MIVAAWEQRMREVIRITAPLASLTLTRDQVAILARGCSKVGPRPESERQPAPSYELLQPQDLRLLALVAEGLDNTQIAWRLKVTHGAARQRVSVLMRKVGVENRVQLVTAGFRLGLLALDPPEKGSPP